MADVVTMRGLVGRELYAPGSKSEHPAVVLTTDDGRTYLLRRPLANPYADEVLESLVGQRVEATGQVHRDVLLLEEFMIIE